jgi:hypothetical protein
MLNIKTTLLLATLFLSSVFISCTPDTPKEEEQNLVINVDPDPGTSVAKAFAGSYTFKLVVTSKMPEQGVEVTVDFKRDLDNAVVFSQSLSTSTSATDITINNLVFNEQGTVTVTVKSKTKATNTAQKTFKLVRK